MLLKTTVLILVCLTLMVQHSFGKVYENKCKLTSELLKDKIIPKTYMKNWVCLINRLSEMNTAAFTEVWEREKYFGLFQIGLEWCKEGRNGGKCDIACESLLDDNIKDDSECAVKIQTEAGFKYWKQYSPNCAGKLEFPDIEKCPDWRSPVVAAEVD